MTTHYVKGDDPSLREQTLERLVATLLAGDDRSLALEEVVIPGRAGAGEGSDSDAPGGGEGRKLAVAAALNAAQSPPFMTARRIVVLRDAGNLTAADAEPLIAYLEDPLETTELIFIAGAGRLPANLTKAWKGTVGEVAPTSEKTSDVLALEARDAGVKLTGDAVKLITARLGDDASRIAGLVAILSAAYDEGAALDADDVEPYLGEAGGVPIYQLTNAIETGDVAGALEVLHRLMNVTSPRQPKPMHPLQALGMLHGNYRRLLRLDDPDIGGTDDAITALGGRVKEYPARKALEQARALRTEGIREAYGYLAQADIDLKGARAIPEDAVAEVLVARLAALSARSRSGRGRARARR
jgi:DNA polymerase-3 subunit delta